MYFFYINGNLTPCMALQRIDVKELFFEGISLLKFWSILLVKVIGALYIVYVTQMHHVAWFSTTFGQKANGVLEVELKFQDKFYNIIDHKKCPSSEKSAEQCIFRISYFHHSESRYKCFTFFFVTCSIRSITFWFLFRAVPITCAN